MFDLGKVSAVTPPRANGDGDNAGIWSEKVAGWKGGSCKGAWTLGCVRVRQRPRAGSAVGDGERTSTRPRPTGWPSSSGRPCGPRTPSACARALVVGHVLGSCWTRVGHVLEHVGTSFGTTRRCYMFGTMLCRNRGLAARATRWNAGAPERCTDTARAGVRPDRRWRQLTGSRPTQPRPGRAGSSSPSSRRWPRR